MPRTKKIIQPDNNVKITKKRKAAKTKKPTHIITKNMVAVAAYYKAERRGFIPGYEENDWVEAERELGST
jgi:hypothetical protein